MIASRSKPKETEAMPRRAWSYAGAGALLSLAAAPTFAVMALLTATQSGGMSDMMCPAMQSASSLTGMVPMYVLMSTFHSAPWLRLIANWRRKG